MVRRNLYLTEEQVTFLESLENITLSEHIRRAVDTYIQELKGLNVSASESKRGEENG